MGLFLVILGTFTFGTVSLEEARDICIAKNANPVITTECFMEALEPITTANHDNYND